MEGASIEVLRGGIVNLGTFDNPKYVWPPNCEGFQGNLGSLSSLYSLIGKGFAGIASPIALTATVTG